MRAFWAGIRLALPLVLAVIAAGPVAAGELSDSCRQAAEIYNQSAKLTTIEEKRDVLTEALQLCDNGPVILYVLQDLRNDDAVKLPARRDIQA